MLTEKEAIEIVIDLVPNWYLADYGPVERKIELGNACVKFYTHRTPTPKLNSLIEEISISLPKLYEQTRNLPKPTAIEIIQEHFTLSWLKNSNSEISWKELLEYASVISLRTYENQNVTFNYVISRGDGTINISLPELQKYLDSLSTSIFTFVRMDYNLNFINFEEINWCEIKDTKVYKFNPEFLQPIKSKLNSGDFSIHLTSRGDIIIMNEKGMLAAKRKRRWKLYDAHTLKNFFVDNMGQGTYRIGTNIYDIIWDLSFKRHGALLVYDPNKEVINHVVNKGSVMYDNPFEDQDVARRMLTPSLKDIPMAASRYSLRKKRLFLEIASMDGAVIFSNGLILAFGAMIETHREAGKEAGARSTAARSAFYWGGYPIKVSSDGEITLYFKSKSSKGECIATTEFL